MINVDLNIIEMCITVLSAIGAIGIGKLHLPGATAQEIKKIIDTADKGVNEFMPGTSAAGIANIIEKIADCALQQTGNEPDLGVLKESIINVLKELNINIDYKAEHAIEAVLSEKTNKNIQPKG